ncbi:PrgI family mobile element protein [Clostridium perfringens]|nr:PrgI family protein [Clostridium perfringens]MDU7141856.1 PrgI family protein [Anaerococcus vaginalis]MDU7944465.1 PrgI family protein [Streptococcus salivarius]MDU7977709.1 PrgI family protein [Clostridioides difficile]EGS5728745.1 hypothetical protein [Clostridium perfringens]EGT0014839.1 hypothetical protein [Clostridium perfringens]
MTNYNIPFDMNFEDKILGGKLTLKQGACYIVPVLLAIILVSNNSLTTTVVDGQKVVNMGLVIYYIIIEIILTIISTIFAFVRVNGYSLIGYLIKSLKFFIREKDIKFYQ